MILKNTKNGSVVSQKMEAHTILNCFSIDKAKTMKSAFFRNGGSKLVAFSKNYGTMGHTLKPKLSVFVMELLYFVEKELSFFAQMSNFKCSRGQFHQHSTISFYARRSQKRKKLLNVTFFALLGISVFVMELLYLVEKK